MQFKEFEIEDILSYNMIEYNREAYRQYIGLQKMFEMQSYSVE